MQDPFEIPEDKPELDISPVESKAKKCLSMPEFEDYKRSYLEAKERMTDELIDLTRKFTSYYGADVSFYGMKVLRIITKIEALRALVEDVERDVRRQENGGM